MSAPIWRQIQRRNFTTIDSLASFLEITEINELLGKAKFPINVPHRLAEKMRKNSLTCPIFKQFVPLKKELVRKEGFVSDPVQDQSFQKTKKLLHKYEGRVLLLTSSACAMHCRFCFRQNFPYETEVQGFVEELSYLQKESSIKEVILSGGDPLSLGDAALQDLLNELGKIPHVRRIRFHTRFPIGIPERIDDSFLKILGSSSKQIFFVVHINHFLELDEDVLASLKKIRLLGIPVLTQTVLLKEINDDVETLATLFEKLVDHGIIPYYLHDFDKVEGGAHFQSEEGKKLMRDLQKRLSGYALPKFVKEEPGSSSKTIIHVST